MKLKSMDARLCVYRATDRVNNGRKENFSCNFMLEYLAVSVIPAHTFSPSVTRALRYLFSSSPQKEVNSFLRIVCVLFTSETGTVNLFILYIIKTTRL